MSDYNSKCYNDTSIKIITQIVLQIICHAENTIAAAIEEPTTFWVYEQIKNIRYDELILRRLKKR